MSNTFDTVWDDLYGGSLASYYPWDFVVSYVFKYHPRDKKRSDVAILEFGCGTGNNLWFCAREGFDVIGVDGSAGAIEKTKTLFEKEGVTGTFFVNEFVPLPVEDNSVDMIIDRGSLTCTNKTSFGKALDEAYRVLNDDGTFLLNPFSDQHSSFEYSDAGEDGVRINITDGSLKNVGQIAFYNEGEIDDLIDLDKWIIEEKRHVVDHCFKSDEKHCDWRIVLRKKS